MSHLSKLALLGRPVTIIVTGLLTLALAGCDTAFTNPNDPARCDPRCPSGKVCYNGQCVVRSDGPTLDRRPSEGAPRQEASKDAPLKIDLDWKLDAPTPPDLPATDGPKLDSPSKPDLPITKDLPAKPDLPKQDTLAKDLSMPDQAKMDSACGAQGQACCGGTCSSPSTVCSGGTCVHCGGMGEPCCAGSICTAGCCGGGGTAGVCGLLSCGGKNCGNPPDGCGGTINCGSCTSCGNQCVNYQCTFACKALGQSCDCNEHCCNYPAQECPSGVCCKKLGSSCTSNAQCCNNCCQSGTQKCASSSCM